MQSSDMTARAPSEQSPTEAAAMTTDAAPPPSPGADSSESAVSTDAAAPVTPTEASASATAQQEAPKRRRGHRLQSDVWQYLTTEENPHKTRGSTCMHCNTHVPHHHKSEKARAHLQKCAVFRRHMATISPSQRPSWLDLENNGKRRRRTEATESNEGNATNGTAAVNSDLAWGAHPVNGNGFRGESFITASNGRPSDIIENLSMFFFSGGVAFNHISNPHLVQLLRRFAPFLSLPSETDLRGQLLDRAFYNVLDQVKREAEASEYKAVLVNSWFNWRGVDSPHHHRQHHQYPNLVYMTSLDDKDLFIEQAPQLASTSSEDYLTEQLASVIYFIGDHATGVVTDNTRENQAMWRRLKKIYPSQFFHGCVSHGLRLFVKNIFTPSAVGEDMLFLDSIKEYPFIFLNDLMEACREVVTFFEETFDQSVRDQFNQGLRDEDIPHPHFPPRNEWYGLKSGFESFIAAAPVLRPLVASRSFGEVASPRERQRRMKIHVLVNDTEFVENLRTAVAILTPLEAMMNRIENEPNMPCSEVFYSFAREIPDALNKVEGVYKDQVEYLLYLNQTRFNGMYGDAHGIAYLLDPRFIGDGLAPEVRKNIEDTIFAIPPDNTTHITSSDEYKLDIAQQLTEYIIDASQEKASNSFRYTLLTKHKKTVLQYWLTDGQRWPLLQRLAVRIFRLPVSTLPALKKARSFVSPATYSSESAEMMKKLMCIQVNSPQLSLGLTSNTVYAPNDVFQAAL